MLYQLLDPMTHSPLAADRTATFIGLNGQAEHFSTFAVAAGSKAHLAAGSRWPLDWTVDVPRRELHEQVGSLVPDSLVRTAFFANLLGRGCVRDGDEAGICFVEILYR